MSAADGHPCTVPCKGDVIELGHASGGEPLRWRVDIVYGHFAHVVCVDAVDIDDDGYLKRYLNGPFAVESFTEDERHVIRGVLGFASDEAEVAPAIRPAAWISVQALDDLKKGV